MKLSTVMLLAGLAAVFVGAIAIQQGAFYQTGTRFYRTCWERAHAENNSQADTPDKAAAWSACGPTAESAVFEAGYIFAWDPEFAVTPELTAVLHTCPSWWSEVTPEGAWRTAVQMIQDGGGPQLQDNFLPAAKIIVRVFSKKWPQCAVTARNNGFPKMVLDGSGEWVYGADCKPCKAQADAIAKREKDQHLAEQRRVNLTDAEKKAEDEKLLDELMDEPAKAPCRAPAEMRFNKKVSKWERDKAEAAALASPECKEAMEAEQPK